MQSIIQVARTGEWKVWTVQVDFHSNFHCGFRWISHRILWTISNPPEPYCMVTHVPLLFIHQMDIFYYFCRTFGPALQHFLSDIHKKCPIVRQVRRISTPLHRGVTKTKCWGGGLRITREGGVWRSDKKNYKLESVVVVVVVGGGGGRVGHTQHNFGVWGGVAEQFFRQRQNVFLSVVYFCLAWQK